MSTVTLYKAASAIAPHAIKYGKELAVKYGPRIAQKLARSAGTYARHKADQAVEKLYRRAADSYPSPPGKNKRSMDWTPTYAAPSGSARRKVSPNSTGTAGSRFVIPAAYKRGIVNNQYRA